MDLTDILEQLRTRLEGLDMSILALERIAATRPHRGRPAAWMSKAQAEKKQRGVHLVPHRKRAVRKTRPPAKKK